MKIKQCVISLLSLCFRRRFHADQHTLTKPTQNLFQRTLIKRLSARKVEVSGSLIKKGKVCRTVAEWKRIIDNGNRTARAVVQEGAKPTN